LSDTDAQPVSETQALFLLQSLAQLKKVI